MFLHLGGDTIILTRELVAIMDVKTLAHGSKGISFKDLTKKVKYIGENNKAKSVVITDKSVYFSPISSNTLKKRANNILNWINDDIINS